MSCTSDNSESNVICRNISKIVNDVIKFVDSVLNKRIYINIVVILLSVGLISGYYGSINDKVFFENNFKTVTNKIKDKVVLIGTAFKAKTQNKLETSIPLAFNNSKDAITKKSFNQLPELNIRSKASIIEIFTNKSFNKIDDSKNLRLGELKWELFSKIR